MLSCPCCKHEGALCFIAGAYRMFRCRSCKAAYVSPQPSEEELSEFYGRYHLSTEEGGYYDEIESRIRADFPSKIALIRSKGEPGRTLDVGCGKGYFVRACLDSGIDAEGIDLSPSGVEFAQRDLGVPAACGRIEANHVPESSYDTVTFWATIEHVPDPATTLKAIHRVLKPGGLLHLDTGIGSDWLDRLLPGNVQWYDPPQHLFVYSAESIRILLEAAGFEVVRKDLCYERSVTRRVARIARSFCTAMAFRAVAELTRSGAGSPSFVRFPIGHLQSWTARRHG